MRNQKREDIRKETRDKKRKEKRNKFLRGEKKENI
jgi:hypothetical protein